MLNVCPRLTEFHMSVRPHDIKRGALAILGGIALLALMDACAKWLVLESVHPMQILAIRSVIIVVALMVGFGIRGHLNELKPNRPIAQGVRGAVGFIAPLAFFIGLRHLPLTDSVVIFFTSVFTITLLSALLLKEKVGPYRWIAVGLGYTGVVVAMSPEGTGSLFGYAMVLLSSLVYSLLFISGRWLSETESVSSLVLSYNLGVGVLSLALLPLFWSSLEGLEWSVLVLLAFLAVAGHFAMTYAFSIAEASSIAPFEYSAIVWTLALDALLWDVFPSNTTLLGAMLIVGSGLYVIHRERIRRNDP